MVWEGEYVRPLFRMVFSSGWSGIHECIQADRKDMIGKGDLSILVFNHSLLQLVVCIDLEYYKYTIALCTSNTIYFIIYPY